MEEDTSPKRTIRKNPCTSPPYSLSQSEEDSNNESKKVEFNFEEDGKGKEEGDNNEEVDSSYEEKIDQNDVRSI